MKKTIKKITCTALAALTVVSGSATINQKITGTKSINPIIAYASATISSVTRDPDGKGGGFITIEYTDGKCEVWTAKFYPKCKDSYIGLCDALESPEVGEKDTSKAHRRKIAKLNGINNYDFTATQNTKMLNYLKKGKLIKSKIKKITEFQKNNK